MAQMEINRTCSIEEMRSRLPGQNKAVTQAVGSPGQSFQEILLQKQELGKTEELKFSKHAAKRLVDRGIELDDNQLMRLEGGTRKAGQKGIVESLVLMDELAFIVNVPSKTVVTAMDSRSEEENIFTNINGAVIV